MTYLDALNYIHQKQSLGIKPGLVAVKSFLESLGNPQEQLQIIHVAGTNGKGTVAATLANALTNAGKKTGLFSSPWVLDYREQIQIDGDFIPEDKLADYVTAYPDDTCTEFEYLTALMYRYFADEGVDCAVVECGMGGAGDATNVESKNISVITSVSLDHTDYLGTTIEEIAKEKSGILRSDCPCVMYPDKRIQYIFAGKCGSLIEPRVPNNLSLVNAVLQLMDVSPVTSLIRLPARLERIGNVLLDGGHNVGAAQMLAPQLSHETAVIGMLRDKDVEGYLSLIAPHCKTIIATQVNSSRAMPAAELADIADDFCDNVLVVENPTDAVKHRELSLVCGSFYLAREVRNILLQAKIQQNP